MTDTPLTAEDLSALLAWTRGEILEWPLRARDGEPLDVILLATCAALTERAERDAITIADLQADCKAALALRELPHCGGQYQPIGEAP